MSLLFICEHSARQDTPLTMKIVKQKYQLTVPNMDEYLSSSNNDSYKSNHGSLLPASVRCIIAGPSNCGKTNAMIALLTDPNGLRFKNVYVYSKSLYQPKYQYIKQVLEPIKGLGYHEFTDNQQIMEPFEAKEHSIFIFDDVACEKQDSIRRYFSMGRHKGVDCFYLSQTYSRIPKQLVRDNANVIVLFKQDERNLRHIFNDHVTPDMTFDEFKTICGECWKDNHGFLTIVKDCIIKGGRYRKGFDSYIYL